MELIITTREVQLGEYRASHADFTSDYGSAPPAPAHAGCTRTYVHGERHSSHTPGAQLEGGPLVWPAGDAIIAALPTLLKKQAAQQSAREAAQQSQPSPSSATALRPVLVLRPTQAIRFHEYPEEARTQRLTKRLAKDGLLRHPPIVGDIGGGDLLLLDGANRVSSLKALGCEEIPVQLVNYQSAHILLKGWHHLLLETQGLNLRNAFEGLPNCQLQPIEPTQVNHTLALPKTFAVLVEDATHCWALQAKQQTQCAQVEALLQRVQAMHQAVACYEGKTRLERIKLADHTTLGEALQGSTERSVVLFPALQKQELMQLVRENAMMPTGLTRHLIPGRALGCNLPLDFLLPPTTKQSRHQYFATWRDSLVGKSKMRFYEESVFLLDE